jgi:hypothetical protein
MKNMPPRITSSIIVVCPERIATVRKKIENNNPGIPTISKPVANFLVSILECFLLVEKSKIMGSIIKITKKPKPVPIKIKETINATPNNIYKIDLFSSFISLFDPNFYGVNYFANPYSEIKQYINLKIMK